MANITLSEIHGAGVQLFQDSESFLNEMTEVDTISGGGLGRQYEVSNPWTLTKLAEAYVYTYGIGHVTVLAKSFSGV